MTTTTDLADKLRSYIADQPTALTRATPPLRRDVDVYTKTWERWFGPEAIDGYPGLDERVSSIATGVLRDDNILTSAKSARRDGHRVISRDALKNLADGARQDPSSADARLRLWVATMLWGSGTSNGRGPRNTRKSLADSNLDGYLRRSAERVAGGIPEEYNVWDSDPSGESIDGALLAFRSKWLWAVSLAYDLEQRPLILDARVRATLDAWKSGVGKRIRYADYVRLAHETAGLLNNGLDGESIEYLLFENDAWSEGERPLVSWLPSRRTP